MKDHQDRQLAAACLAGDTQAFSVLVDRHADAVYNLAYRLCGNAATAQDVAQEAFIRAYRRLHQYKPEHSFRNWVLGICANLSRSRYRWWRRKQNLEQVYATEEAIRRETEHGGAQDNVPSEKDLERALMALPETLRAPVVLKYMEGMTIHQVAETLQIRLSAAKMRLVRGREQLYRMLKRDVTGGAKP